MIIIRPGKLDEPVTWRGECRNCLCIIECEEDEAKQHHKDGAPRIPCPTQGCGGSICMFPKLRNEK